MCKELQEATGFDEEWKKKVEVRWKRRGWKTSLNGGIRKWEVERALSKLKNSKAVGVDGVVAEVLK